MTKEMLAYPAWIRRQQIYFKTLLWQYENKHIIVSSAAYVSTIGGARAMKHYSDTGLKSQRSVHGIRIPQLSKRGSRLNHSCGNGSWCGLSSARSI